MSAEIDPTLQRISHSFDRREALLVRLQAILDHVAGKRLLKGPPMSEQRDAQIKALIKQHPDQLRREHDMAEASRRGRLLQSEPEQPLPDVPLHKRGFGVVDEDAP